MGIKDAAKLPTSTVISSIRAANGSPAHLFDNVGRSIGFATVDGSNGKEVTLELESRPTMTNPNAQFLARTRVLLPKVANAHCAY